MNRQWFLAGWLAHYGDADAAFSALWRSQVELTGAEPSWLWLPVLSEVRRKPEFKNLLTRVGLVDCWRATGNWGRFCRPLSDHDFVCS